MRLIETLSATWLDIMALVFLIAGWMAYAAFAVRHGQRVPNLHNRMDYFRREWMVRMIERDNRMVDVNVMRNLTRSSQFFASTTMFILGALIALTGYVQQTLDVVSGLPFTMKGSARLLEIKIGLLIGIFVFAFFKFTWAIRQLNFTSILIASAPKQPKDNPEQYAPLINRITAITSYAATNFNNGLRAYYLARRDRLVSSPVADDHFHGVGDRRAVSPRVRFQNSESAGGGGQLDDAGNLKDGSRSAVCATHLNRSVSIRWTCCAASPRYVRCSGIGRTFSSSAAGRFLHFPPPSSRFSRFSPACSIRAGSPSTSFFAFRVSFSTGSIRTRSQAARSRRKSSLFCVSRGSTPLHLLTLLLVAAGQLCFKASAGAYFVYPYNDLYHFFLNLFFASSWGFEKGLSYNAPVWSVSVEVALYALFFVLCKLLPIRAVVLIVIAIVGFFLAGTIDTPLSRGLPAFFLGGCAYLSYRQIVKRKWTRPALPILLLMSIGLLAGCSGSHS